MADPFWREKMPEFVSPAQPEALDEARVVGKAVLHAADLLDLKNAVLANVLGLSQATMSRLKTGDFTLDPTSKAFELAVLIVRLFRGLDAIVGGDTAAARSWMNTENKALHDKPISLIKTISGLMQAVQYVDARRARV